MSRNSLPKARIHPVVRNMFTSFEVDTKPVAELLDKFKVPVRRIGNFVINFEPLPPKGDDPSVCGYYDPRERDRIHVIAGRISDGAYDDGIARPGHNDPTSFEAIITHEIGHYLWINNSLKRALKSSDEEHEEAAMLFERKCTPTVGSIVTYEFKPEFIDATSDLNITDTWTNFCHEFSWVAA